MLNSSDIADRCTLARGSHGRPAAFFDRDGVLNVDKGYVHRVADFEWIEGAKEAIRYLNARAYAVIVVTNQSGVARGYFQEKDVLALHDWMGHQLGELGAWIDAFYYCPTHPEGTVEPYRCSSEFRKPAPGMILQAISELGIDKSRSFMIGDKPDDLIAATRAGIRGRLFDGTDLYRLVTDCIAQL